MNATSIPIAALPGLLLWALLAGCSGPATPPEDPYAGDPFFKVDEPEFESGLDTEPWSAPSPEPTGGADDPNLVLQDLKGGGSARPEAGSPVSPPEPSDRDLLIRDRVNDYLERLRADEETAEEAFRELWEVQRALIPALILETENRRLSALMEIQLLVLDKKFLKFDENTRDFVYRIPGLGRIEYDEVAVGDAREGDAWRVFVRKREGRFPLGVVLRAALINRFQSNRYPPGDDRQNTRGWWQRYYQRVRPQL